MLALTIFALVQAAWALPSAACGHLELREMSPREARLAARARFPNEESLENEAKSQGRKFCVVRPNEKPGADDAPAIMDALNNKCRSKGLVFLPGPVYNIRTNMTTLDMDDVVIHQYGRLVWSADVEYWRSVSMPVGFQNQSTVWYFGGNRVTWDGWGVGTLDGNGQVWYDWAKSQGNLPRRPMNVNFRKLTNSAIKRLRFVQSQMWTMAITYSSHVELDDIYVNSTSTSRWNTLNTDGCDTVYSDSITFRRWDVTNGDDAIALKGNSSNIAIYDSVFRDGQGVAIGSMGQYDGKFEYITNFYARNITLRNTAHVSYLKTWAGTSRGFPPNGGGGGVGHATNITMEDIKIDRLRSQPFFAWQCENYSGWAGKDCNSSRFKLNDIAWRRVSGTVNDAVNEAGWFQCSAGAGGCDNIQVSGLAITKANGAKLDKWHCDNVHNARGFQCDNAARTLDAVDEFSGAPGA